jgi:hypothetical protein
MKLSRLNFVTALVAFLASGVWFAAGQNVTGVVWLACSLVWLALAIARLRSPAVEPHPASRLARRVSRLLLWG